MREGKSETNIYIERCSNCSRVNKFYTVNHILRTLKKSNFWKKDYLCKKFINYIENHRTITTKCNYCNSIMEITIQ